MKKDIDLSRLFEDVELPFEQLTQNYPVFIPCADAEIYALVYPPSKDYEGKRPCIFLAHGFPGNTTNDDLAHAFRRAGFLVVRVLFRGAWGNEGYYSFSNNIHDGICAVNWMKEHAEELNIDTDRLFLVGHSVGGQTVLNMARKTDARGIVALAPYDCGQFFVNNTMDQLAGLTEYDPKVLKQEYKGVWLDEVKNNYKDYYFLEAVPALADKDILFIEAKYDEAAFQETMVDPLIAALIKTNGKGKYFLEVLNDHHDFGCSRTKLARLAAEWMAERC